MQCWPPQACWPSGQAACRRPARSTSSATRVGVPGAAEVLAGVARERPDRPRVARTRASASARCRTGSVPAGVRRSTVASSHVPVGPPSPSLASASPSARQARRRRPRRLVVGVGAHRGTRAPRRSARVVGDHDGRPSGRWVTCGRRTSWLVTQRHDARLDAAAQRDALEEDVVRAREAPCPRTRRRARAPRRDPCMPTPTVPGRVQVVPPSPEAMMFVTWPSAASTPGRRRSARRPAGAAAGAACPPTSRGDLRPGRTPAPPGGDAAVHELRRRLELARQTTCSVPAASVTAEGWLPLASSSTGSAPAGAAHQARARAAAGQPTPHDHAAARPHPGCSSRSIPSQTAIASARGGHAELLVDRADVVLDRLLADHELLRRCRGWSARG